MIRAEQTTDAAKWIGRYNTGRFWHTVREEDGEAACFPTQAAAIAAAQTAWWAHGRKP